MIAVNLEDTINACAAPVIADLKAFRLILSAEIATMHPVSEIAKLTGDTKTLQTCSKDMRETYRDISEVDAAIRHWG